EQLEGPVRCQGEFEQRPGEAAPGFDQGEQAATRDIEPLQGSLEVVQDLVDQPVVAVSQQQPVIAEHPVDVSDGAEHPRAQLVLVGSQVEDQVVQFAGEGEGPEVGALRVDGLDVGG